MGLADQGSVAGNGKPLLASRFPLEVSVRVVLILLLIWFAGWDVWAVLTDQRQTSTDTTTEELYIVQALLQEQGVEGLKSWYFEARKGPLVATILGPVFMLGADPLFTCRLFGVVLNLLCGWLVYLTTKQLGGGVRAGLLAVVVLGTFPGHFGWIRMDSHEAPLVVFTLLTLHTLMRPLTWRWLGLCLGLLAGFGFIAKTSYPIFVLAPGLLWAAAHLRSPRMWRHLGVAMATVLLMLGPWLFNTLDKLAEYLQAASGSEEFSILDKVEVYLTSMPGTWLLLLCGTVGAVLAVRLRVAPLFKVGLLSAAVVSGMLLLVLVFDLWSRYLVPAFPPLAILAALGLEGLTRRVQIRWSPRAANVGAGVLAAGLLGLHVVLNLVGVEDIDNNREWGAGMVSPDQRSYLAFPEAIEFARKDGGPLLEILGWPQDLDLKPQDRSRVWRHRGWDGDFTGLERALFILKDNDRLLVLFGHQGHPEEVQTLALLRRNRVMVDYPEELYRLLLARSLRVIFTRTNPNGYTYSIIEAAPRFIKAGP